MEGLPLRTKLLYASSSLGSESLLQSRGLWLLYYYAPPADAKLPQLLPLGLAGAILFATRLTDAVFPPLIGYWSDRTRSRLGRRLPFILGATPLWALFALLLFTPPPHAGTTLTAAYLFLALELYGVFSTLSGSPYESLLPEIATTSDERVSVVGIKVYFGAAGGAAGLVGSGLIVDHLGFKAMALTLALLALVFRYVGMAGVWHRVHRGQPPAAIPLGRALRTTLTNRYFLLYLPSFVLFQVGLQMLLGVLPYYVKAVLGVHKPGTWVAALTAVAIATVVAVIPVYQRFARRTSKRQAFRTAMLGAALAFPLLSLVGVVPGLPKAAELVALMALAGIPIAGVYLFPAALTADIIDYDSLQTGMRREAIYYGAHSFAETMTTSLAPLVLSGLLLLGRTAGNQLGLRLVGPVAGLVVLAGYLIFRAYDLPDDVLAARALASRRRP